MEININKKGVIKILNKKFNENIRNELNVDNIIDKDFTITENSKKNFTGGYSATEVIIEYRYMSDYYFKFVITGSFNKLKVVATFAPGEVLNEEKVELDDAHEELMELIHSWVLNIKQDLQNTLSFRKAKNIECQLRELEKELNNKVNDLEFTNEEKEDLINRLEKLENELEVRLQNETELKNELESLTNDIEFLKEHILVYSKKDWLNALTTRAMHWFDKHPTLTKTIEVALRQVFTGNMEQQFLLSNILSLPGGGENRENNKDEDINRKHFVHEE